ncbi:ABC transporter ATP-binding protein [Cryobacterium sp. CG_9.6]|uniref:ABC transporter ATP-binding protein n=1 Tax=Cryobacterium sp. CG_9.6 TaxID=2760710 RepID=UPI0024769646|nr:ABC transporter ATP-binding protein [Cryobacterium sp. CG_9.6]MDH6238528.1 ABC-2 type transport system ATP-binding protein [Cryobacterium sp. CG_9.6]
MTSPAIRTWDLSRSYSNNAALSELSIEIDRGEVFGLLGHNGAGKTTTVNLLTTLLTPTAGRAEIDGRNVVDEAARVRRSIGYLPENVQFYDSLTLIENLRFFGRLSGLRRPDARIADVLRFLEFTGHDNQRVGTFSKGMRQRVGIAQAMLHEPAVLFLDEPTSGLDPEGVRTLRETIVRLNREYGMTVFMNTHLLSEVTKTCTSIGILNHGRLVHHDTLARTMAAFPAEQSLEEIYFQLDPVSAP